MRAVRDLARSHRHLVGWFLALALAVKLLVPAGFMLSVEQGRLAMVPCEGMAPRAAAPAAHAMPGHDDPSPAEGHGEPELPCAFAGLQGQALAALPPALLVALLLFIREAAFRPASYRTVRATPRLRPPGRAPPLLL